MPSTSMPFGLKPVSHTSGAPIRLEEIPILSTYAANIFEGTPVKIHTDGTINVAAAGDRMIGCFRGCKYTDSEGRPRVTNRWVSGTVATDAVALVTRDPEIIYEIQGGAIAQADVGTMADHSGVTGNTVTGLSSTILDTVSASTEAGLQVVGISSRPGNAASDTYTVVLVKIVEHQDRPAPDSAMAF